MEGTIDSIISLYQLDRLGLDSFGAVSECPSECDSLHPPLRVALCPYHLLPAHLMTCLPAAIICILFWSIRQSWPGLKVIRWADRWEELSKGCCYTTRRWLRRHPTCDLCLKAMAVLLAAMLVALLFSESAFQQTSLDGKLAAREWRMHKPDAQIWHVPNPKAAKQPSSSIPSPMLTPSARADSTPELFFSADPVPHISAVQPVDVHQPLHTASPRTAPIDLQPAQSLHLAPLSQVPAPNMDELPNHHCTPLTLWTAMMGTPDFNNFTPWDRASAAATPTQLAESSFSTQNNHDARSPQVNDSAALAGPKPLPAAIPTHRIALSTALLPYYSFATRQQLAAAFRMPGSIHSSQRCPARTVDSTSLGISTALVLVDKSASTQHSAAVFAPLHRFSSISISQKGSIEILHIRSTSLQTQHLILAAFTQPNVIEACPTPQADSTHVSYTMPALLPAVHGSHRDKKPYLQSQTHQTWSSPVASGLDFCLLLDNKTKGDADQHSNAGLSTLSVSEGPFARLSDAITHHIIKGMLGHCL